MKKLFSKKSLEIAYLLFGLVVLLGLSLWWLPLGYTAAGHDSGLPLNAFEFLKSRLWAWDDRNSFGTDNSPLFGSLTLHFIDYLSAVIAGVSYAGNWFNVFFWLGALFTASWVFARTVKEYVGKTCVYVLPPLLVLNFYIFQSIFILERAKYSVLVALLLFTAIYIKLHFDRIKLFKAALLSAIVLTLFNSGSLLGLPLYGSFLSVVSSILLLNIFQSINGRSFAPIKKTILFLLLTGVIFVVLNSYQILPYVPGILSKSYLVHLSSKVLVRSTDWVDYISHATSYLSLFRLQGVPSWYHVDSAYLPEPTHMYAGNYFKSIGLIALSFFIPIIAFASLFQAKKYKEKTVVYLFSLITFISIILSAGTHPPFGQIYKLLYENLPGFDFFRTPYYKFAGGLYLGYAVLFAFSVDKISTKIISVISRRVNSTDPNPSRLAITLISLLFLGVWLSYHYYMLLPQNVFSWKADGTTKFEIPAYTLEAGKWLDNLDRDSGRVLLLPGVDPGSFGDGYKWGYWSLSPLYYSLTSAQSISNELTLSDEERGWVDKLYERIYEGDEEETVLLSSKLGIRYFLLRKDTTAVLQLEKAEKSIVSFSQISKTKSFGLWDVYELNSPQTSIATAVDVLKTIPSSQGYLAREFLQGEPYIYIEDLKEKDYLKPFISEQVKVHKCESCLLENKRPEEGIGTSIAILPNSPFYVFKERDEERALNRETDLDKKKDLYLGYVVRRAKEVKTMVDSDVDGRYITENLDVMNDYLSSLERVLFELEGKGSRYVIARQLIDILFPIRNTFEVYASSGDFRFQDQDLKPGLGQVLWQINNLSKFYDIEKDATLQVEKNYSINIEPNLNSKLYINSNRLPLNGEGRSYLPKAIRLYSKDGEIDLSIEDKNAGKWLPIKLPKIDDANFTVKLFFDDLPNMYRALGEEEAYFPGGRQRCAVGGVVNFSANKLYKVSFIPETSSQELSLFMRETYEPKEFYNKGLYGVRNIQKGAEFIYDYKPSSWTKDPKIYICNKLDSPPDVTNITIKEVYEPQIASVTEISDSTRELPTVTASSSNPTSYDIKIQDAKEPFVLMVNMRTNALWRVNIPEAKPLIINGYAMGWYIDKKGTYVVSARYIPQQFFIVGSLISVIALLASSGYLLRRKNEHI